MTKFQDLQLSEALVKGVHKMGFEEATPIQAETIPVALTGVDVLGQAQTGTGKTAAFGIPTIERIDSKARQVQALVLAPTRELAIQVAEELNKIGETKRVYALPVYGGQQIDRQIRGLKKNPQIVVATPGRLMDHMKRKTIKLDDIQTVILDEADEMLNMGFVEDIETILAGLPEERQTLLFSATMPPQIKKIAERFMKSPTIIKVKAKEMTVENINQQFIELREGQKFDTLCRLIDIDSPELSIIFARTKKRVDEVTEALIKRGYTADGLHGDLTQSKRDQVIRRFKNGTIDILVATDVAARGLDISGVTHVYNFDVPQDPESYVHRIGRTGRAGKTGTALTFITPREFGQVKAIERVTNKKMNRRHVPTIAEVLEGNQKQAAEELIERVQAGDFKAYTQLATELLEEYEAVEILAAALRGLTKEPDSTPVEISYAEPVRVKRQGGRGGDRGGYRGRNDRRGGGGGRGGDRRGGRGGERRDGRSGDRKGSFRGDDRRRSDDRGPRRPRD
ncbi:MULTISPECIES: DEAD/DEAH box helicase [Exiguobacterium]|uniref:DEAD/DEAH box helicase n=1 Tax=Exiguobacterium TaxID=33986 RepID=UPI00064ADD55|nr:MULTISPECIES: DEAD/DEAH box helicase [unclassified Exiguobacterium]MCM3280717.1 DEAD/DEAH box helicase [Exiguobacterium sp. MER 193]